MTAGAAVMALQRVRSVAREAELTLTATNRSLRFMTLCGTARSYEALSH